MCLCDDMCTWIQCLKPAEDIRCQSSQSGSYRESCAN